MGAILQNPSKLSRKKNEKVELFALISTKRKKSGSKSRFSTKFSRSIRYLLSSANRLLLLSSKYTSTNMSAPLQHKGQYSRPRLTTRLGAIAEQVEKTSVNRFSPCQPGYRDARALAQLSHPLTQCRNNNLTTNHCHSRDRYPKRMIILNNQYHGCCHHHLVGNRVNEGSKAGCLVKLASKVTIKPVS